MSSSPLFHASEDLDRVPVALAVSADRGACASLEALAGSLGHGCIHAHTIAEVRMRSAAGGYAYVLIDIDGPTHDAAVALSPFAEAAVSLLSMAHRIVQPPAPIFAIGGAHESVERVSDLHRIGIKAYIIRHFEDRGAAMRARLRLCLLDAHLDGVPWIDVAPPASPPRRAGRAASARVAAAKGETIVHLAIVAHFGGEYGAALVDGTAWELTCQEAGMLVRLMDASLLAPCGRVSLADEGAGEIAARRQMSRIRVELRDKAGGIELIPYGARGAVWLGANVVIDGVPWALFMNHPDVRVQAIAAKHLRGELGAGG